MRSQQDIMADIEMRMYMLSLDAQVKDFPEATQDSKDVITAHMLQTQREIMDLRLELDELLNKDGTNDV